MHCRTEPKVNGTTASLAYQRVGVLNEVFSNYNGPPFSVRLWDGSSWCWGGASPVCTIVVRSQRALKSLLLRPTETTLGEAFVHRDIDVEGDVFAVFDAVQHLFASERGLRRRAVEAWLQVIGAVRRCFAAGRRHSVERDKAAIAHHYDQPAEFYRPWLGESMVYSCAYFRSPDDTLDTAQFNKLDLICRKLRLNPGERFLDVGCGWGGLVMHAAAHHGAFAHGVTISEGQAATANRRIEQARLTRSCRAELLDYRSVREQLGTFDKVASVGMVEHVGVANLPEYFRTVYGLLKPGGAFLNHGITHSESARFRAARLADALDSKLLRRIPLLRNLRDASFIDKYVFPDGELPSLTEVVRAAEQAGFEVRDEENLREHYARTLRLWVEGLRSHREALLRLVSEETYRIWLLYMAGCSAALERGEIAVHHVLLSRPEQGHNRLPLVREDLYR